MITLLVYAQSLQSVVSAFLAFTLIVTACARMCQNGGTLNVGTCTCDCANGYVGATCGSECTTAWGVGHSA